MKIIIFFFLLFYFPFSSANAQPGWTLQTNPLGSGDEAMLGKVQCVSATEAWISVSNGAKLLHTVDAGANWSIVTMSASDTVASLSDPSRNLFFISPTTGWVLKTFGTNFSDMKGAVIYKTTNGGNDWQRKVISQNPGDFGFQIQFIDALNGFASVANFISGIGYIYKTTDGGDNWNQSATGPLGQFSFVDVNNGWSISLSPVSPPPPYYIKHTSDGGANWTIQFTDNTAGEFLDIQSIDLNNGWVVGREGKILKTTNGGINWSYVTNSGMPSGSYSKALYFLNTNTGWITTKSNNDHGIVLHTTNGGTDWLTQPTPLTNPSGGNAIFSINFYDAQNGWLIGDYGKICRYSGSTGIDDNADIPINFSLSQNYPNPFNPTTIIEYSIPQTSSVLLKVYNLLGQEVATLVDGIKNAGTYKAEWNAAGLNSGVYFYTLQAGSYIETKKLILMK